MLDCVLKVQNSCFQTCFPFSVNRTVIHWPQRVWYQQFSGITHKRFVSFLAESLEKSYLRKISGHSRTSTSWNVSPWFRRTEDVEGENEKEEEGGKQNGVGAHMRPTTWQRLSSSSLSSSPLSLSSSSSSSSSSSPSSPSSSSPSSSSSSSSSSSPLSSSSSSWHYHDHYDHHNDHHHNLLEGFWNGTWTPVTISICLPSSGNRKSSASGSTVGRLRKISDYFTPFNVESIAGSDADGIPYENEYASDGGKKKVTAAMMTIVTVMMKKTTMMMMTVMMMTTTMMMMTVMMMMRRRKRWWRGGGNNGNSDGEGDGDLRDFFDMAPWTATTI